MILKEELYELYLSTVDFGPVRHGFNHSNMHFLGQDEAEGDSKKFTPLRLADSRPLILLNIDNKNIASAINVTFTEFAMEKVMAEQTRG